MGKKGRWFSAIKRVFTPNCKEKPVNELEKKSDKEKKKRGIFRHGEKSKSFIPLFRKPSSIEKILEEADEQKLIFGTHMPPEQSEVPPLLLPRGASPRVASPRVASPQAGPTQVDLPQASSPQVDSSRGGSPRVKSPPVGSPRVAHPKVPSPRASSPRAASSRAVPHYKEVSYKPEPTLRHRHLSATKIQAAYRGYMARRSLRALKGLVRLQSVVRGQNVKRQTAHAMKMMQLLVRVQTQIQSRRIQMLENQALQCQAYRNSKDYESSLGKWSLSKTEAGQQEDWDDSFLTKEEVEARLHKKAEAIIKRERAMAYAYSHQLWKSNPKSAMDIRSGGFPWWWNWLDRQLPLMSTPENQTARSFHPTPSRQAFEAKPSPQPSFGSYRGFDNLEALTPRSTRSAAPLRTRNFHTPPNRTPSSSSVLMKYSRHRSSAANSVFDIRDDDSLTSCPPFSVPNYMTPTASARAKVRTSSTPKDRLAGIPRTVDSGKRLSFPPTPNSGTPQRVLGKDLSIDSSVSMAASVGRKPFNRFV